MTATERPGRGSRQPKRRGRACQLDVRQLPRPPAWLPPVALAMVVALPALVLAVNTIGSGWRPVSLDMSLAEVGEWRDEHPTARRIAAHVPWPPGEHVGLATSVPYEAWLLEPEPVPEPPRPIQARG